MLLYLAKIARTPYLTSHGPDANTVVTTPASVPQGVPSQLTASINFAWSNNAFNQNVGAAEYYIDTPPWAGGTAIPMNGTFNSPTVAVDATINTASLSVGRHVIFVRGRGVSDFQGFQTWGPISAAFLDVTGGATPTPTATSNSDYHSHAYSHSDGNSHCDSNTDSDANCHSDRFSQSDTDTQTNAHSEIACDTAATSDSSPAVAVIIHACASRYVKIKIS